MKNIIYHSVIFSFLLSVVSCSSKEETSDDVDTDKLYNSTLSLIKTYTDSLRTSADTMELSMVFANFNHQLEKLNFDVVPDTDLHLTEDRNDTLYMKLMDLRRLYDDRKKELEAVALPPADEEGETTEEKPANEE